MSYEKDSTSSGVKHTWYINSPYGLVAVYVKENTTETLYYAETDHLGSLVALRNTNGTVVESYSYDPWGRRRNPSNWSYSNVPEPVITNRGFTGHEHLERFNLIDMNGRVYDPVTAGFLSPDPFVANPYFSQSYNSYSYCVNNPLKFTDPSGYLVTEIYDQSNPYPDVDYVSLYVRSRALGFYGTYSEFVSSYDDLYHKYSTDPLFYNSYNEGGGTVQLTWHSQLNVYDPVVEVIKGYIPIRGIISIGITNHLNISSRLLFGNTNASSGRLGRYSIDNAVNRLTDIAHGSWKDAKGECGTYIRWSIEAGFGLNKDALKGKTVDQTGKAIGAAKTMGPYLENIGFRFVNATSYLKGDIAVIQGYPGATSNAHGETYGHVQMYDGSIWISDFKQLTDFWPGGGYRTNQPSFVIYRWGN